MDWLSTIDRYLSAAEEALGVVGKLTLPTGWVCSVDGTKRTRFRFKPAPKYL